MKISIITASYNYADYIEETLKSVLKQTYQDWELIIVDDGSTDNSLSVANFYSAKDNRIRVISQENAGVSAAGLVDTSGSKPVYFVHVNRFCPDTYTLSDFTFIFCIHLVGKR